MEEIVKPADIEKRSFEIIEELLGKDKLPREYDDIIKRAVHTTGDLEMADNMVFSENAAKKGTDALLKGCTIVTDTQMAKAGINRASCEKLGVRVVCYMSDPDVAEEAKRRGVTRARVSMEKAARLKGPLIFAIGNAPTALFALSELIDEKKVSPALCIAVPVGFVNVVESKERIIKTGAPYIAALGRKGGSAVAAAICNALLYRITRK